MFTTLAALKGMLGIPLSDTSRDPMLQVLVDAANKTILDVFGGLTDSAETEYTDKIDVDDDSTWILFTRRWPVMEVTEVIEGTTTLDASAYSGNDLGAVKLLATARFWATGRESVEVTYTAGWDTVPGDLVYAATLIAVHGFNTAPKSGLKSEKIGQYSYELGGASVAGGQDGGGGFGIPPEADRILANYRRVFTLPN